MPALSHLFHLTPADVWDLTHEELEVYLDAKREMMQARTQ